MATRGLRELAKGQACINCGTQDGTVVLAHYTGVRRLAYGGGLGKKVHDLVGAHLCFSCHRVFDTDSRSKDGRWIHSEEFQHRVLLTLMRLWEKGLIGLTKKGET